jgi:hypothetical protein
VQRAEQVPELTAAGQRDRRVDMATSRHQVGARRGGQEPQPVRDRPMVGLPGGR